MTNSGSYSEVLKIKGVQPFLWMQFLNAFNDNVYKLVVSLLAVYVVTNKQTSGTYLSLAGFIFVAPFLIFAAYAGQLADKFEKRTVLISTKAFEIGAMVLALFALLSGRIEWMLAVLFFTATQAAFFSPAKYGIVPELVESRHLARANGLLEMSTFVAVILGTVVGTLLVAEFKHQTIFIGLFLITVAILGTSTGFRIVRTPAPSAQRPFSWNPLGDVWTGCQRLTQDRTLLLAVLGTTYFWFLGALFQMLLLLYGKETLHVSERLIGLLMASLAIGIGTGSMAAGRLSGDKIEPGLIPIGAFGMAAASLLLAFMHSLIPAAFFLAVVGFMGGLFVVPLNAMLQHRPAKDERGRILATANFANTIGMMFSSAVVWLLHELIHFSAAHVIAISAALTLAVAIAAFYFVPTYTLRFLLYCLFHSIYKIRIVGRENIPQRGPALIVANHATFIDGFLIGACIHRFVRYMVDAPYYDRFTYPLSLIHAIRVPAGNRRTVLKAIELARQELQAGHAVCIFAEGALTQSGNIGEFYHGLERIVAGLDVPVVPVHLGGVWNSIFSLNPHASLWNSIKRLRFPITVSFGAHLFQPSSFDVRQRVTELGANTAQESVPSYDNLAKRFVRVARKHWSQRAIIDSTGRTLTYGETLAAASLFAKYVQRKHTEERMIGIILPASAGSAIANLGIVLSGHIPVNLNFTAGRDSINSAIRQCGISTIITSRQFLTKGKVEERPEMIFLEDLLKFPTSAKLAAFLRMRFVPAPLLSLPNAKADDMAAVLFSSGSTAEPKGIMLSHRNLISNTESVNVLFQVDQTDTIAGVLPFFHSFGFTYTLWFPLLTGAGAAYHAQPLDAKGLGELVEKSRATFLPAPPTFCQAYLRGCTAQQFSSLRYVLVGAERLQPALADAFYEKFHLRLLEGYGATEMSPVISVNVPDRTRPGVKQIGSRPGTVGQPIPGVAAKVVDRETGEPVSPGEVGILLVKGPNRMLGYLNRPAETEKVLRDGWYVTGDIVTMTEDGFIKIVDRQSRFSKIAGEMVPHNKIEETVQSLFAQTICVVTGVADDRRGERLVAFIEATSITSKEVWSKLIDSDLPKIWIPKSDDIYIIEKLPVLGTGKIDLRAITQMALALA